MKTKEIFQLNNSNLEKLPNVESVESKNESQILNVFNYEKGAFDGFGGAITNASAYNYSLLSKENKTKVLEMLVGKTGLNYSVFRLCIGSSDFARESYSYVEENDFSLATFSIEKDADIINFVKDIINYASYPVKFFASSWSMPAFMKTNNDRLHGGRLKKEFYQLYAEYIVKFLKAYSDEGINITSLTIQNEPKAIQTWESCEFSSNEEAEFAKILKNVLDKNDFSTDLYCWDHNKERLVERASECFEQAPNVFAGAAFHWYSGQHFDAIDVLRHKYPTMKIMETEFCVSHGIDETDTMYEWEIINNLRMGTNAIVEWNVLLDENGGPYHDRNKYTNAGCEAPIMYNTKTNIIEYGKTYWSTWMFAHFIEPNSTILATSTYDERIKISAIKNTNGDIVINIVNNYKNQTVNICYSKSQFNIKCPINSITTIIVGI